MRLLRGLKHAAVTVVDAEGEHRCGEGEMSAEIRVENPRAYRKLLFGGSLAAAESYIDGWWTCSDLVGLMRILAHNADVLLVMERGFVRLLKPFLSAWHWLRRNTRTGSRKNIAAHYDLSNDFFALFLDPTMTYSCGIFHSPADTMEQASLAKYDRICRKLQLSPRDHVVEIGTGWGGFAIHAAKQYGCRVTTTTISERQHEYACRRVAEEGLSDRVQLLRRDYRDLDGQYDKLVSIEMIEAVGHGFLDTYFRKCSRLLKDDGMMALQAITIPDHHFDRYRGTVDFIQRFIFPGSALPSHSAIGMSLRRATDFRLFHSEDIGPHYARTLCRWRERFWENIDAVRELGFDERFIRMWHYYLCYCEGGFTERYIGVSQLLLTKPGCRREPLLVDIG